MDTEQVIAIKSAIDELEEEDALAPGERPKYFARFTVAEQEAWIEIVLAKATVVNLWYPFSDEPFGLLREEGIAVPEGAQLIENADPSCTFSIPRVPSLELARFVDTLFQKFYAMEAAYPLEIEMCAFE